MIERFKGFEISTQHLSNDEVAPTDYAPSRPLPELLSHAPTLLAREIEHGVFAFPFANDARLTNYFEQMQARTTTAEYREASNRVAILIGESRLAVNLQFIPEETIIMLDSSPTMCEYFGAYSEALKTGKTTADWMKIVTDKSQGVQNNGYFHDKLIRQAAKVNNDGYGAHPLLDDDAFKAASNIAKSKAIIPWRADVTDPYDMRYLGLVLRALDANVTFLNLTNVIQASMVYGHAADYVQQLSALPIAESAPILTTSTEARENHLLHSLQAADHIYGLGATGPFFGLHNLARGGGSTNYNSGGAVMTRQIVAETDYQEFIGST